MNIRDLNGGGLVGIPLGGTMYSLCISGEIEPFAYDGFVSFLETLSDQDIVKLTINTQGGCTATTTTICDAIGRCPAYFIAELSGLCYSCGTAIALSCDEWVVGSCVDFMIHSLSHATEEFMTITEFEKQAKRNKEYSVRFLKHFYQDFLTAEEFDLIDKGDELYFYSDTLPERLKSYEAKRALRYSTEVQGRRT